MKAKQHLILAIFFFALLTYELIVYKEIITEPYMVGLCLFLSIMGGWNLGRATIKFLKKIL